MRQKSRCSANLCVVKSNLCVLPCRTTRTPCRPRFWSQQGGSVAPWRLGLTCPKRLSVSSRKNRSASCTNSCWSPPNPTNSSTFMRTAGEEEEHREWMNRRCSIWLTHGVSVIILTCRLDSGPKERLLMVLKCCVMVLFLCWAHLLSK